MLKRIGSWVAIAAIAPLIVIISEKDVGAQSPQVSPLAQYPGFGHNNAADEARYRREQSARQRHIAECMRAQGFTYTPVVEQTNPSRPARERQPAALPPTANRQFAESLPADRRLAYNRALYGVDDPNDPSGLWDPESQTGGGCWGDALRTY